MPTARSWTKRALFLIECLALPSAAEDAGARWEPAQIAHLCDDSTFRIEDKSRQIGWSFVVAAEALASAILDRESTIFVSINQDEAMEKIRYARRVYDNLDIGALPIITRDNDLGLEFDNGARLISLPSRPPRGKAKMHIVLDEFAHVQHDREIYGAALPIISRGGRLRIGSSPMGAAGMYWEISREELRAYPGFTRVQTPWWRCRSFCEDGSPGSAAEGIVTEERVGRWGNERIRAIYDNMLLDDFQQEYECMFLAEGESWIAWETIQKNQAADLLYWHARSMDQALDFLPEIRAAIADARIEQVLAGGVDVGRKKDLTEIILVGMGQVYPVRFMVSLDRVRYDDQEQCLRQILGALPVKAMLIDQNGIGAQLAENLSDTAAEGVGFTNASKELWAVETRIQMERGNVPLPRDRALAYQIHSIKKKVTVAKNNVFDTERNEKHHADKFWALALALAAAKGVLTRPTWGPRLRRR